MAKLKIRVKNAYVDGNGPGSEIAVDKKSAEYLERIGYAKVVGKPEQRQKQKQTKGKAKKEDSKPEEKGEADEN